MGEKASVHGTARDWPLGLCLLDRTKLTGYEPVLSAFARDELLGRLVGASGQGVVHLWRHPRAFVLGLRDSRLPGAGKATAWLQDLGYSVAVRNSGGAAVPLDLGVLNVSLVMPKGEGKQIIRDDFYRMVHLLQGSFAARTHAVRPGEVDGSYCPGEFDLAIDGRKFCGIAQRRQANAIVVQAFIVVEGAGAERAARVRAFYEKAAGSAERNYPQVRPETMGSLSELIKVPLSAFEAAEDVVRYLQTVTQLGLALPVDLIPEEEVELKVKELEARYAPPAAADR